RLIRPGIGNSVMDRERDRTETGFDAAMQQQCFAKRGYLHDLAFRPQDAVVAIPPFAIADEPSWTGRDASVKPIRLGLLRRIMILLSAILYLKQRVVEATGGQQSAAEGAQKAKSLRFGVPGSREADWRLPGDGQTVEVAASDVKG